jgi:hypothetical protein
MGSHVQPGSSSLANEGFHESPCFWLWPFFPHPPGDEGVDGRSFRDAVYGL